MRENYVDYVLTKCDVAMLEKHTINHLKGDTKSKGITKLKEKISEMSSIYSVLSEKVMSDEKIKAETAFHKRLIGDFAKWK